MAKHTAALHENCITQRFYKVILGYGFPIGFAYTFFAHNICDNRVNLVGNKQMLPIELFDHLNSPHLPSFFTGQSKPRSIAVPSLMT